MWSMGLERPETRVCCGGHHRCGSATGDTNSAQIWGGWVYVGICTLNLPIASTWYARSNCCWVRTGSGCLYWSCSWVGCLCWCWILKPVPVETLVAYMHDLVVISAHLEPVFMQSWGLHAQPNGELDQGTAAAWCHQTSMGGIPSDVDAHQSVLSQNNFYIWLALL